jgi:hypothetical protein
VGVDTADMTAMAPASGDWLIHSLLQGPRWRLEEPLPLRRRGRRAGRGRERPPPLPGRFSSSIS